MGQLEPRGSVNVESRQRHVSWPGGRLWDNRRRARREELEPKSTCLLPPQPVCHGAEVQITGLPYSSPSLGGVELLGIESGSSPGVSQNLVAEAASPGLPFEKLGACLL